MIRATGGGGYASQDTFVHSFEALQSFREDNVFCDIKLKTDDGKIVNGHKIILASASPYFRAMFTTHFVESSKECVTMGLNSTDLRLLVDFIYTAQIIVTEDNVKGLLHAANYLQINDVQDACCNFLQTKLQPANCIGIKAIAEFYGCTELLSSCKSFIQQHFLDVIICDEFLSLSPELLLKLISIDELPEVNDTSIYKSVMRWENYSESRKGIAANLVGKILMARIPSAYKGCLQKCSKMETLINNSFGLNHVFKKSLASSKYKYTGPPKIILAIGEPFGIEWYNPITRHWKSGPETKSPCRASFALLKDQYIFSIGGIFGGRRVEVFDLYSSSTSWVSKVPMITERYYLGVAVLNNCIYAVGGRNSLGHLSSAEVFDCNTEEWRMVSSMANRRNGLGVGVLDNLLYAVGGHDGMNYLKSVECYDPSTDTWKPVADMCSSRGDLGIGVLNGQLYAVGGNDNDNVTLKRVEVFRPNTGTWSLISDMNVPRRFAGVVALGGLLYVVGGIDEHKNCLKSVEIYNPSTDTWSMLTGSLNNGRCRIGAFIVENPNF